MGTANKLSARIAISIAVFGIMTAVGAAAYGLLEERMVGSSLPERERVFLEE